MKFKSKYFLFLLAVVVLMIFLADTSFAQCSMCRKIATDGANSKAVGASLNKGILYLLAMPYCLLAFFFRKQIAGFMRTLRPKK
jgi:membrane glycosyltransferase